jgi:hypothetical protein
MGVRLTLDQQGTSATISQGCGVRLPSAVDAHDETAASAVVLADIELDAGAEIFHEVKDTARDAQVVDAVGGPGAHHVAVPGGKMRARKRVARRGVHPRDELLAPHCACGRGGRLAA